MGLALNIQDRSLVVVTVRSVIACPAKCVVKHECIAFKLFDKKSIFKEKRVFKYNGCRNGRIKQQLGRGVAIHHYAAT